jgi:hypothetical protein
MFRDAKAVVLSPWMLSPTNPIGEFSKTGDGLACQRMAYASPWPAEPLATRGRVPLVLQSSAGSEI